MRRRLRLPLLRRLTVPFGRSPVRPAVLVAALVVLGACTSGADDSAAPGVEPPPALDVTDAPVDPGLGDNEPPSDAEIDAATDDRTAALRAAVDSFDVAPAAWADCGDGFDCATVEVPLDHLEPGGERIEIALRRRPADGEALGSLFINPGGPGGSGTEMVGWFTGDPRTLANYDVVGFDPRGVGESTAPSCSISLIDGPLPDFSPDDAAETATLDELWSGFAAECAASDGELLAHLGTEAVAADLELLRRAVGDETLTYVGYSYGSDVGLNYAELFGDRAGRLVLDGIVDPSASLTEVLAGQAAGFDAVMARADAACGSAFECGDGGLLASHDRVSAALENAPVGEVGPTELATAMILAGYDEGLWPLLADALVQAEGGDMSRIELLSDSYYGLVDFTAYVSVNCLDTPSPDDPAGWDAFTASMAEISPRFGPSVASDMRACAHWPVGTDEPAEAISAPLAPPILVIGTVGDPATPFGNAVAVAEALERGVLVTHEGEGHTIYGNGNGCIDELVSSFLVDGIVPDVDPVCPA